MTKVTKQLYKYIKKLKKQGLAQKVIAERLNISQTAVSFIVNTRNYKEYLDRVNGRKTLTIWQKIYNFLVEERND